MGDGTVKYPGYKTHGKVKRSGMKNKRKRKMRLKKEAEMREQMARQRALEEREAAFAEEWQDYQDDNR